MPTHKHEIKGIESMCVYDRATGGEVMSFSYPLAWKELKELTLTGYDKSYYLDPNNIEKVIFNDPATVVIFKNGEKTIVKTMEGEEFNHEVGFLYAMAKHLFDSRGEFVRFIEKWKEEDK